MRFDKSAYRICPFCKRKFINTEYLIEHIMKYHPSIHISIESIEESDGIFITECLNCGKELLHPIPYSVLEDIEENGEGLYPPIFFCSKSCQEAYGNIENNRKKSPYHDTAPWSPDYTDQYDWNR